MGGSCYNDYIHVRRNGSEGNTLAGRCAENTKMRNPNVLRIHDYLQRSVDHVGGTTILNVRPDSVLEGESSPGYCIREAENID